MFFFQIEQLDLDGCPIADLGLDFVLPGHANTELCRGGRDIPVTIHNLHQYISLVTYWFLIEGVQKQFEALREGKLNVVSTDFRFISFFEEAACLNACIMLIIYVLKALFIKLQR